MGKFSKATKKQARARIALQGPGGSGKTWTALELAAGLGERIAVVDSERGSASKYSDRFAFDVLELDSFGPEKYVEAIRAAESEGYDVLIIDSLSHAWTGKDGILERVDRKGGMAGWKDVTPQHNRLVDAILSSRCHVICTLRVKTEYAYETNDRGKVAPRKVGLAPVQKDGLEYEFDVVAALDTNNNLSVEKTRCATLQGRTYKHQNPEIAAILKAWLTDGAPATTGASGGQTLTVLADARPSDAQSAKAPSAPVPTSHPALVAVKQVFPAAVEKDAEREAALAEVRQVIGELGWEVARARTLIRESFPGKSTTKELDRAESIALRDLLRVERAKTQEAGASQ